MNNASFSLKYDYPISGNKKIDEEVKLEIDEDVKNFLAEYLEEDSIYRLEISYEKKVYQEFLSYLLYKTFDLGGAHPTTLLETINFMGEERIYIENILSQEKLEEVSQYVRNILLKKEGALPDMVEAGTKAEYANFRNFYFNDKGITFLFEEYQVAPYSAGIIEVTVPYEVLNLTIS